VREPVRVVVVGGGSFGTAFSAHLGRLGLPTTLLVRDPAVAATIEATRRNPRYLSDVELPPSVSASAEADGLAAASLVVLAIPSRAYAGTSEHFLGLLPIDALVLSLTKGLEPGTGERLSRVLRRGGLEESRIAVLSGPNHAEEIARSSPTAAVVSSASAETVASLQALLSTDRLRLYGNGDLVGVELAAASKNVIAIAAGVSDGLGFGDNAKAALLTRGLAEITRLGLALGADPRTFAGLAGLGDLVATCCSTHSRNRAAGELLGRGVASSAIEGRLGMVAEGLATAPTLLALAARHGVEMPIAREVAAILDGSHPASALESLMRRDSAPEW
jgi:glycerol-3-phosphate dehydrogenase (NAD(P)+)